MANAKKPTSKRNTPKTPRTPKKTAAALVAEDVVDTSVQAAALEDQPAGDQSAPVPDEALATSEGPAARDAPVPEVAEAETERPAADGADPSEPVAALTSEPARKSGGVLPLVVGGAIAGAIGFLAAELNVLGMRSDGADLRIDMQQQASQIAQLQRALETPVAAPALDLSDIEAQLADLGAALAVVQGQVDDLAARPVSGDNPGAAAEVATLQALQASVAAQKQEIEALLTDAKTVEEATTDAARLAVAQSAVTQISNAIAAGTGFADALTVLGENGVSDIPAALRENAKGVASLASLQTSFPDAARAGLASARAQDGAQATGFGDFLKRQLGARSVAPREGSDPDAILSRVEAALRDGQLAEALAQSDALPPVAADAMSDWLTQARARAAVETALDDVSQRLRAK